MPHQRDEPGIEIGLPAQHAGGEFVGQAPVSLVEVAERLSECLIEGNTSPDRGQDVEGRAAGEESGSGYDDTIPVVGDDGTATSRRGMRPAR
jgi:hypothetical protein